MNKPPQAVAHSDEAWHEELSAGHSPWRQPRTWLGSAVVMIIAATIVLTISIGWETLLALFDL